MPEEIDLNFLARQIERLITDARRQQDDMAVLTAMVIRLDGTTTKAILDETLATKKMINGR